MKKALIGLCNNITLNKNKINQWSKSFKKYSNDDVILIASNVNQQDIETLSTLDVIYHIVDVENSFEINHKRLLHTKETISILDYDFYLVTDVFDVIFQGNPFNKLDLNNYDLFISGEGILISQEPWNSDNILKLFPNEIQKCRSNEILNSGIIAGKKSSLIELFDKMYSLCESTSDRHNIKDQAALNVMFANNELPNCKILNLDDSWAIHCAVSGPTQFFESWGFKNNLRYGIPYFSDGAVFSKKEIKFDIVHQFNRIPEWNNSLTKEYE